MPPMKFATKIVALQHRKWSQFYLDYNGLKRILAEVDDDDDNDTRSSSDGQAVLVGTNGEISLVSKPKLDNEVATSAKFHARLLQEVQKISLFVIKEEGILASDLQTCHDERMQLWTMDPTEQPQQQDDAATTTVAATTTDSLLPRLKQLRDKYNRLGADLFFLTQFVDINFKGLVRILKKHDKRVAYQNELYDSFLQLGRPVARSAVLAAPLYRQEPLDALCVELQAAFSDLRLLQELKFMGGPSSTVTQPAELQQDLERGRSMDKRMSSKRGRSPKGLGRRHRSIQGLQALGDAAALDDEGDGPAASPELEHKKYSLLPENDTLRQDDFIMAQIYAARRNINQTNTTVLNMLATTALGFNEEPPELSSSALPLQADYERAAELAEYQFKSKISGLLNLVSSFIYMANYLIVVPTVVTYSQKLGADPALSSAIVGMTPFATIFSTIVYSWWTSYSYRIPLAFAAFLNVVGNFIYALGYPCNSMTFVLLGRLMSGLGSCRPINRRFIADAYSTAERTAASALFVAVGSFGMALGPFLGSVLHRVAENSKSPYWQVENAPGWFMGIVWLIYLIFHLIFFVDPPREDKDVPATTTTTTVATTSETKPLLSAHKEENGRASEISDEDSTSTRTPIWRNAAVMVNFYIYFIEKLLMECVSSSTSIMTYYYFQWPGSWAGYYLSFLCLLVLPVNVLVAHLSKTYEDREMMFVMQAATVVGCLVILQYGNHYNEEQYLLGSMIIVVFSNMVEGPNMSLLSKTIPKSWRKGFLNVGLLATEAATLGRTVGDAFLALCGAGGLEHQLNYTFGSMTIVTALTLWISYRFYDALVPTEDKTL